MLNKRVRDGIRKIHNPTPRIKFCLGTLAIVSLCVLMLVTATFSQIKISFNIPDMGVSSYLKFEYIPQIPVVIFIAALLGEYWGLVSVLLYVILGLTPLFPVFALGGGPSYIFQYNFGYIFGFLFAVLISAKMIKKSNGIIDDILAVIYGVLAIHVIGSIYLTVIALLRHDTFNFIGNLIYFQSISKIMYDLVFGFIAVLVAKGLKKLMWVFLG